MLKSGSPRPDKPVVCEIRQPSRRVRGDERDHTMSEVLTALSILGVLLAIAVIVFLALLERWRV